ncbi:zinc fyve-like protein [Stemphylium lycopersici]|uniref:Zinc fyve-like protein n=1 Tax=Stemphylium lycopersici TaxID=183478 RepID=A0A364NAW4_STELY|nr:zinc fyve-like protein [Stemphylium lycopersici]RAR12057.1 zinc fyve-like protein [Stemphylium lycopersici]RAR14484.1 zinc fyve-like protein [Stemphylium lycopersici]
MATTFSTATAIPQHAPYQQHAYRKSTHSQYSPTNSGMNTPANISPTSPRSTQLPLARHQGIYQPRTAIGIPAALRKTEKPGSKSPPKVDSGLSSPNNGWSTTGAYGWAANDGSATPVSQIGNEDMQSLYNAEPLSPVAGPITRNHWQADGSTLVCSASSCQEPFGFFQRRHHCRKCGGIFCAQHSRNQVRLDELARFHPEGQRHRACDRCYSSFREWEHLRSSRTNSESSDSSGPAAAKAIEAPAAAKRPENTRVGSIAQSLQGTWNWSTF